MDGCNICEYKSTNKSNYQSHDIIHGGRKYECNCEFRATTQSHLTYYIQYVHEGVNNDCNQCDYRETMQDSLICHIQLEQGVKYDCNQCDYRGTMQSNLICHIKSLYE